MAAAFAASQPSGQEMMRVDQDTATHRFDAVADGGRIELRSDLDDPAAVEKIRRHLKEIAKAFASGDSSLPAFAHLREVPGALVMAARKDRIQYVYRDLPRGAELRLVTNDPEAIRAIHQFMNHETRHHGARNDPPHGTRDHPPHGRRDHPPHSMMPGGGAGRGMHASDPRAGEAP